MATVERRGLDTGSHHHLRALYRYLFGVLVSGIATVMPPAHNVPYYDEIPPSARDRLKFIWLETVDDAVAATLK